MKYQRGTDTDLLCIGSISKPQGIRGELKVVSGLQLQDVFLSLEKVYLQHQGKKSEWKAVRNVRAQNEFFVLKLEDVQTRNDAELYRGYDLYVQKDQIPDMPENTYFVSELIGIHVQSKNGDVIGKIDDVLHMPAHDIYVINTGEDEILIPAVKEFVKQVDLENSRIIIQPIDGMIDSHED